MNDHYSSGRSDKTVHFPEKTGRLYRAFQSNRVVHRKDILSFYDGKVPLANINIQRLLKSKRAVRIKTGVYYFKKPDEFYDDLTLINPLLVAGKVHPEGLVVYHTALRITGNAYSESRVFQVGVPKFGKPLPKAFLFQNAEFRFFHVDTTFGLAQSLVEEVKVQCFSKERILLEGLLHPDRFFGLTEFLQSVDSYPYVNPDTLFEILPNYPMKTAAMRLGWLLERFQKRWYIQKDVLKQLEDYRTVTRLFLVSNQRKGNKLVRRWNLMVPSTLDSLEET